MQPRPAMWCAGTTGGTRGGTCPHAMPEAPQRCGPQPHPGGTRTPWYPSPRCPGSPGIANPLPCMEATGQFDMWRDYLGLAAMMAVLLRDPASLSDPSVPVGHPCAGPAPRVGPAPDAGPAPDVGPAPSAGPAPDVGPAPAAGPAPSSGPAPDVGPPPAAGPAPSAGPAPDVGPAPCTRPTSAAGPAPHVGPAPAAGPAPCAGLAPCSFCQHNGEAPGVYQSHSLRDAQGRLQCPVLRSYVCPQCGATQDQAHTRRFCPRTHRGYTSVYSRPVPARSARRRQRNTRM